MQNKERIVLIKRNKQTTQRTNFHVSKFHSATCILKKHAFAWTCVLQATDLNVSRAIKLA